MTPWLIPLYFAGCAVHSYIWNRVANETWDVREGGLTRKQLMFVLLWPLTVTATICFGIHGQQ